MIISAGNIPEWAEGCKLTPTDLHRQCAAEHHGEIPRVTRDQEQVNSVCCRHVPKSENFKNLKSE